MKTARTRDVEESEGEKYLGLWDPRGDRDVFVASGRRSRIVFVAVTLWLGQSYMDIGISFSLLVLMGISTFTSKEFIFLQGIWLIGNDKIRKGVDWWLRHWGKDQTFQAGKSLNWQAMLEAIGGYACGIYVFICSVHIVSVCVSLCPSLSLVAYTCIYILCIDMIDMYKITSLYDFICVCIIFPHYIYIYTYVYIYIYYIYTNTHAHVNPPYDRTKDIRIRSPPIPRKNHPRKKWRRGKLDGLWNAYVYNIYIVYIYILYIYIYMYKYTYNVITLISSPEIATASVSSLFSFFSVQWPSKYFLMFPPSGSIDFGHKVFNNGM